MTGEKDQSSSYDFLGGVDEDVEDLLKKVSNRFDEHQELRFDHFVDVWKEMKFYHIYRGRPTEKEAYQFAEGLLETVKLKIISPGESIGYKAAGIYALYALYFQEPPALRAKLRLTLQEYRDIQDLIKEYRSGEHWDVTYCWAVLFDSRAFNFSATSTQMGFETVMGSLDKRDLKPATSSDEKSLNPFKCQEFQSQMSELSILHDRYSTTKKNLCGKDDPSLSLVNDKLFDELHRIIDSVYESPTSQAQIPTPAEGEIGSRRQNLREKFFSQTGDSMRQKEIKNFSDQP